MTICSLSIKHTHCKVCFPLCHPSIQHCISHCWRKPRYSQLSQTVTLLQVVNLVSFPFILILQKLTASFTSSILQAFDDYWENTFSLFAETFPHKLLNSSTKIRHSFPENTIDSRGFCISSATCPALSVQVNKHAPLKQTWIESVFKLLQKHFSATFSLLCLRCQQEVRAEAVVLESHGNNPTAPIKPVVLQ